ncbi:hypothetical protein Pan258_19920 [Symmachiella dynata]|uniref:DUF1501 domain-containing protein n=1 Tax=Symmachiella dynata TaxID=2527995 RepID=UPI001189B5DE|nr:DUF1501 domain-containing protein [Symmachiella dynata]QDT47952.1 hypothetical protein Pan258_19920 [Symmachiella dynata]
MARSESNIPRGMSRRHFMRHLSTGAMTLPALQFINNLNAHAADIKKNQKSCILLWLGGGPPTIDMWDLKPGSKNGGELSPIATTGDMQISEALPKTAQQMKHLSLIRSMSTREADHGRGRYYMHTAYVPNPTVVHPTFGSVVSKELGEQRPNLEIPAFISIGGGSEGPGFLGMANAAFNVDSSGNIRNAGGGKWAKSRLNNRLSMLNVVESNFIKSGRGGLPQDHADVYHKAVSLMTTQQLAAFKVNDEPEQIREAYGNDGFGRGCLLARRLVESGVPFVEVNSGGWDLHMGVFDALRDQRLPALDQGLAALTADLADRGLLEHTVIVCMGEFGRTPRINQNVGRDHWAASWSAVIGGGGLTGGITVGATDKDGIGIEGKSYLPGDLWATVSKALGIPLDIVYTTKRKRPMKIANGGKPIAELIG